MAHRQSIQKEELIEKPARAAAVRPTLRAVTLPAPSRLVSRSLIKLETMVPPEISMEITPAQDMGTFSCPYMEGQAEPRRESGRPRLMKAR